VAQTCRKSVNCGSNRSNFAAGPIQAYAPLSESRIPALSHRIRFCKYTTKYTVGDSVASTDNGMRHCFRKSLPVHWRAVHGCQTVGKQLKNVACSNLIYAEHTCAFPRRRRMCNVAYLVSFAPASVTTHGHMYSLPPFDRCPR
jgi:hypothetical protein